MCVRIWFIEQANNYLSVNVVNYYRRKRICFWLMIRVSTIQTLEKLLPFHCVRGDPWKVSCCNSGYYSPVAMNWRFIRRGRLVRTTGNEEIFVASFVWSHYFIETLPFFAQILHYFVWKVIAICETIQFATKTRFGYFFMMVMENASITMLFNWMRPSWNSKFVEYSTQLLI